MTSDTPDRLDYIIAEYLAAEELGDAPPPEEVLLANPDLAEELRRFFANREQLADALPREPPRQQFVPPKVRYFGDYELQDEVARGGMGVVYRAKQTSLNRIVAIKMILAGHLAGDDDVKRFRTEAEAAANLHHPSIVPVHEVGVHEGQHYFSMDYIEGRSLAEIVRENLVPARKAAEYVRAIAEAVQYAHGKGTLHRDLKPSNILIDANDAVHVTDFGLAVRAEDEGGLTQTGQILGTPAYMSPEQAQGKRGLIGPASDVYSLGVILYELLTGRQPFKAESSVETLRQVIEHDPVPPRTLNAAVPRDLETICLKCLRKDATRRYTTAESLRTDLGRWLNHEPIRARPVSRVQKLSLWCRRRPAVASSIAVILLTACLVAGFTLVERQRNLRERVKAAVAAMGTVPGALVPHAIADFEEFPRELVISELRDQFKTVDDAERLALAFALAHFGDVRIAFLVAEVNDASPDHCENFVTALCFDQSDAVLALEAGARRAESDQDWRLKARLAMLALHLEAPAVARNTCRLRPDPVQRTWFIEECSTWHGDLSRLARLVSDSNDVSFRTAVAFAAGSAPRAEVAAADRRAWESVLSNWYQHAPDNLTHSAAGWMLRNWKLPLPEIAQSTEPSEGVNWHVNHAGMTMLRIPAGVFSRSDEVYASIPDGCVILRCSYLLSDREVTRSQYRDFMDDLDCPDGEKPLDWNGADIRFSPTDQHPVQNVNWNDAVLFCNWLSRKEGFTECYKRTGETEHINGERNAWRLIADADGYRLPTEAEWEYACRAGTVSTFSHGEVPWLLGRYAVHGAGRAEVTASRLPNAWGLFDMHGNIWEWCHDWHGRYGSQPLLVDPRGPDQGTVRIVRGGSFAADTSARSTIRGGAPPAKRFWKYGFRVLRRDGPVPVSPEEFDRVLVHDALIPHMEMYVDHHSKPWRLLWELASLKRFVGDIEGYHDVCREMSNRYSASENGVERHALLLAYLSFPEGEVTPELLEIAQTHAESNLMIRQRMPGLAYYRLENDDQALPILERVAANPMSADSKIASLLCLALVQLRLEQYSDARESISQARTLQQNSPARNDGFNRQPWGVIPSLWREVRAAMADKLDELIPDLPPTYAEWTTHAASQTEVKSITTNE